MSTWKSVYDELPEDDAHVIWETSFAHPNIATVLHAGFYRKGIWRMMYCSGEMNTVSVRHLITYWRYFPTRREEC